MKETQVWPLCQKQQRFLNLVVSCVDKKILNLTTGEINDVKFALLYNFYTENNRVFFNTLRKNQKYLVEHLANISVG